LFFMKKAMIAIRTIKPATLPPTGPPILAFFFVVLVYLVGVVPGAIPTFALAVALVISWL